MIQGYIHSIESMGLVDGPGIRSVVFFQGCRLRCLYCHNPDTWEIKGEKAKLMTPRQLVDRLLRFRPYYGQEGGVTFSGGEPLMQPEFLAECLAMCREEGLHTCLDTAGCGLGDYEQLLKLTDLVLLDLKHYTPEGYRQITGQPMEEFNTFLRTAQELGTPLWLRHVVVPGLTDGQAHLAGLSDYIAGLKNVQRVELLPYHTLGVHKYRVMGIPYPLEGTPPMEKERLEDWNRRINERVAHSGPEG